MPLFSRLAMKVSEAAAHTGASRLLLAVAHVGARAPVTVPRFAQRHHVDLTAQMMVNFLVLQARLLGEEAQMKKFTSMFSSIVLKAATCTPIAEHFVDPERRRSRFCESLARY
jgi:hypothetical protein